MKSKTKRALTDTLNAPQTKKDMTRSGNTSAEKTTRKIEVGWLHFSSNQYHQVRTRNGGGTRHTTVEKTTTVAQILEMAKGLFFPNGNSTKGPVEDFTFTICDFKRNQIPMEDTVGNIYEQTKLRLLRFYLCSKEAEVDEDGVFSSEVFSEEEDLQAAVHDVSDPTGDVLELRSSSDSDNEEQAVDFPVLHPISRKQRTSETVASQSPERLHHLCSTPTHTSHSSKQLQPNEGCSEGFEVLGMDETVEWDPEDHTSRESDDNVVVITLNCDQEYEAQSSQHSELLLKGLHFQLSDDLYTVQKQSAEESVQNVQDNGQLPRPPDLPLDSSSQLSPSSTADNLENSGNSQCISVRRIKVVDDLLSVFMDSKIMNINLKMVIVNEKAVDDDGVSREIYTAFWEQFLDYCEGEDERVPRLRPDFWDSEWQAVGRIWVKGLLDHGVLPVRLCKAFILACIHGIDYVDEDILMSSFLNYLPLVERSAVESALHGTMDDSNEDDLMDLFTRMGSHSLPPKNNFKAAIETMAHKAILQEPKYVIDCFAIPMAQVAHCRAEEHLLLITNSHQRLIWGSSGVQNKRSTSDRDRVVVGISDKKLSQRLELIPNLILDMTVQEVQQSEELKVQRLYELIISEQEFDSLKTQPVKTELQQNAQTYAVATEHRVAIPLLAAVKEELGRMEASDITEAMTEPTEWCALMVPVQKKNGRVRICVDLERLNRAVKRERFTFPRSEEMIAQLSGYTVFSSLNAASGFWQIPLDKDIQRLTTFVTPYGSPLPEMSYAPGKALVEADVLSRSPQQEAEHHGDSHTDVECYIATVLLTLFGCEGSLYIASSVCLCSAFFELLVKDLLWEVIITHPDNMATPSKLILDDAGFNAGRGGFL
ncbi:uncharacterized protein LOC117513601 [Thalassophryne amazonica]|uniref:uncharacterized protein LOC117513601 n=1 Tax=Thalassophryne amazonica TaxID=390379 RepID=UPI0014718624|nr:uncharacterized protein LOC117513601 [Thalassophryne amazonica]